MRTRSTRAVRTLGHDREPGNLHGHPTPWTRSARRLPIHASIRTSALAAKITICTAIDRRARRVHGATRHLSGLGVYSVQSPQPGNPKWSFHDRDATDTPVVAELLRAELHRMTKRWSAPARSRRLPRPAPRGDLSENGGMTMRLRACGLPSRGRSGNSSGATDRRSSGLTSARTPTAAVLAAPPSMNLGRLQSRRQRDLLRIVGDGEADLREGRPRSPSVRHSPGTCRQATCGGKSSAASPRATKLIEVRFASEAGSTYANAFHRPAGNDETVLHWCCCRLQSWLGRQLFHGYPATNPWRPSRNRVFCCFGRGAGVSPDLSGRCRRARTAARRTPGDPSRSGWPAQAGRCREVMSDALTASRPAQHLQRCSATWCRARSADPGAVRAPRTASTMRCITAPNNRWPANDGSRRQNRLCRVRPAQAHGRYAGPLPAFHAGGLTGPVMTRGFGADQRCCRSGNAAALKPQMASMSMTRFQMLSMRADRWSDE